jgi:hypothetical protein
MNQPTNRPIHPNRLSCSFHASLWRTRHVWLTAGSEDCMLHHMLFVFAGLPYDLGVYWQQYPWVLGETLCKLRALGSEM